MNLSIDGYGLPVLSGAGTIFLSAGLIPVSTGPDVKIYLNTSTAIAGPTVTLKSQALFVGLTSLQGLATTYSYNVYVNGVKL